MGFLTLESGCHVFTLYNLCHYLRTVCVTISMDTFMSSHWSDHADGALSLVRGSKVQTATHDTKQQHNQP